jgi:polar amino acid transport system substrate-binding protein
MLNKSRREYKQFRRRLIAAFLGLALAAPVLAQEPASPFPQLFDARERLAKPDLSQVSRLRFLTTLDFPPFNFADQTGRPTGFHVDLARAICEELDIAARCQIQAMPYEELQPALDRGEGDAIIAGVAVTSKLREGYLFSRPYMMLPARFLQSRKASLSGPAATALAGKSVGVVEKSAHEAMLKSWFPQARPVTYPDRPAMLKALREGAVDVVFGDGVQLSFWAASDEAAQCCAPFDGPYQSERFLGEGLAVMLPGDGDILQQAVDHALLTLSREGRLNELYLRYFPYGLY